VVDKLEQPLPEAAPNPSPSSPAPTVRKDRLAEWTPNRTQVMGLIIGLLAASNIALWITLQRDPDTRPVTVVAVRQMTREYVRKITSPQLSEAESVVRANLFIAAAQDELQRLVPSNRLVLARECVLSGTMNDITPELQKRVEAKLAQDTTGLSNVVGPVGQAGPTADQIQTGNVSAASLLTPSAAPSDGPVR
jgi:hypothetical protein